jgi:hypothetical protein
VTGRPADGPETREPAGAEVEEEYDGPARLVVGEREIVVHARLSGHFEPLSGRYHWAGRLHPSAELHEVARPNRQARLVTEGGRTADATIREEDPWGGFRISGSGRPPFAVPTEVG